MGVILWQFCGLAEKFEFHCVTLIEDNNILLLNLATLACLSLIDTWTSTKDPLKYTAFEANGVVWVRKSIFIAKYIFVKYYTYEVEWKFIAHTFGYSSKISLSLSLPLVKKLFFSPFSNFRFNTIYFMQ